MFSVLYNLSLLILGLFALPKLLWQRYFHGKYRGSLKARLGITFPAFIAQKGQEVIWIHAISIGETRAVIPLFQKIRQNYPKAAIVISTTTETGQAEAKRCMPDADAHFFLPLDFSWTIRRLIAQIQPTLLILCESDFWYHLLTIAKQQGTQIALINGKISERSCKRFKKIPFFTKKLFSTFDIFCVQNERYRHRLISMNISSDKIFVTGNLKFDIRVKKWEAQECQSFRASLNIHPQDRVLVIGSTHHSEEDWILSALTTVWKSLPSLKVFLVPRHPERFNEVAHLIEEKALPFYRISNKKRGHERLILIDAMGQLNQYYQIADLAIVGGSFTSRVGGHNIFEPVALGVPVFFGPYMFNQSDLEELILSANAGKQATLQQLPQALIEMLVNPELFLQHKKACHHLAASTLGATDQTFSLLPLDLLRN